MQEKMQNAQEAQQQFLLEKEQVNQVVQQIIEENKQ